MALRITGIPSSFSSRPVTGAKSSSSAPAGSAGATYANSSGQLINSAGAVVGGAVTKDGVITYGSGAAIPGSGKFVDNNLTGTATGAIAPITQSTMGSATAVNLPNTPVPNAGDYSGILANTLTSNGLKLDGSSNTSTTTKDSSDVSTPNLDSLMANELNLRDQNAPVKSEAIYNSLPEKAAKEAAAREVNQYQSQLNGIVAQRDAQVLQLREVGSQNGVTEAVYGGQKATIEREAAIRALPVSAQLAAAQGNLELAQDNLNTLFKLRVNDANATFEYKNKIIDSVMKYATASEQRVFEQKKLDASNALDQKKTNLSSMNEWAKIALGQPSVMTQFTSLDPSSSTFQKDLAAVQSQVVDFKGIRERQLHKANLDKVKAETEALTPRGLVSGKYEFGTKEYDLEVITNSSQFKKNLLEGQRTRIESARSALSSLETLNQLMTGVDVSNADSKAIFDEGTGPVKGRLRTLEAQFKGNSSAAAINATITALLPKVARGIFGEVGVLTDNDIANYRKTVGSMNLPGESNKGIQYLLSEVLLKTYAGALTTAARNQQDVSLFADEYQDTVKRVKVLKDSISGNPYEEVVKTKAFEPSTGLFNIPTI